MSRFGPFLSHIFFANDLIIFGHADLQQSMVLRSLLERFCEYSGHWINAKKTYIYFSKGVDDTTGLHLSSVLGFHRVHDLSMYLGVPLLHEKISNSTLHFVVDKIRNKLNRWDARKLSIAGKATLAQTVPLSIPNYFM